MCSPKSAILVSLWSQLQINLVNYSDGFPQFRYPAAVSTSLSKRLYTPAVGGSIPSAPTSVYAGRCHPGVLKKLARRSMAAADSDSPAEINTGQTCIPCRQDSNATLTPAAFEVSRMRVASL
jgi:hypothetical protein